MTIKYYKKLIVRVGGKGMNIHNIALVRATNIIPFDGIVKPISNVPYLCKNISGEFSSSISDILNQLGIRPDFDWT